MRDQMELAPGDQGIYHRLEVVGQQGQAIVPGFSGLAGLAGTTDIVTDHQILLAQGGADLVPDLKIVRVAMNQHQGRRVRMAFGNGMDSEPAAVHPVCSMVAHNQYLPCV